MHGGAGWAALVKNITRRARQQANPVLQCMRPTDAGRIRAMPDRVDPPLCSAMASGVKDLKVWQEAVALAADVVRAARKAVRRETKSFTDPLMQSAVAVACSIAHGYASYAAAEQRIAYQDARRALLDLETRLTIARQAGILQATTMAQLAGRLVTVSRLLSGYVAYIDRQEAAGTGLALAAGAITVRTPLADEPELPGGL